MNKSLFNISDEYIRLINQIEENEGVLDEHLEKELEINKQQLEEKIKSYYHIIKEKQAEIQLIKDENERLSKISKIKDNLIESIKHKVLDAVNLFGYTGKSGNKKLDFDTLKVYTGARESVEVNDIEFVNESIIALSAKKLDDRFKYTITRQFTNIELHEIAKCIDLKHDDCQVVLSKSNIKLSIEAGVKIPGCQIVKNQHITFK